MVITDHHKMQSPKSSSEQCNVTLPDLQVKRSLTPDRRQTSPVQATRCKTPENRNQTVKNVNGKRAFPGSDNDHSPPLISSQNTSTPIRQNNDSEWIVAKKRRGSSDIPASESTNIHNKFEYLSSVCDEEDKFERFLTLEVTVNTSQKLILSTFYIRKLN